MGKDIVKRYEIVGKDGAIADPATQCDIEFLFTNLSSKAWKTNRLLIQRRADAFIYSPDRRIAYAGFNLTTATARKILDVYLRICTWKTVLVQMRGSDIGIIENGYGWLHCLLLAFASGKPEEYCAIEDYDPAIHARSEMWIAHVMNPETFRSDSITIPCKCVRWNPDLTNPSKYKQDYYNAAVACGCDRCPLFDMGKFHGNIEKKLENKPHKRGV